MERRDFLVLLGGAAVLAFAQSCGGGGTSGPSTSTLPSGKEARSSLARVTADPTAGPGGGRAINALGADLYGRLAAGSTGNLVFSPASVMFALAMTRAGALGATAEEMDAVLHVAEAGAAPGTIHPALNALTATLATRTGSFPVDKQHYEVELSIVNSLWGQDGFAWVPAFLDLLATDYGAGMRLVDYRRQPEPARAAINAWVDAATKHRIPELLSAGTITPAVRLTLVNAIYLKAPWLSPFPESGTASLPFTTPGGGVVTVPTMRATAAMRYGKGQGWQAVEVPYVGDSLAMLLLVPDAGRLADIETRLAEGVLDEAAAALSKREVHLGLPKFDLETKAELSEIMAALGMPTAFDPGKADFSGMTLQERLFISLIIHQANITVDEKGTEAAAATAVVMRGGAVPGDQVIELMIDRPFLYAVRDVPTGAVLFLGRVTDPS